MHKKWRCIQIPLYFMNVSAKTQFNNDQQYANNNYLNLQQRTY